MKSKLVFLARYYLFNRMPYYAVAKGRKPGIYATWDECSAQVNKFPGSIYKKFATETEAQNFIKERSSSSVTSSSAKQNLASGITKPIESKILPKRLFPLGNKQTVVAKKSLLTLAVKRSFSTGNDISDQPEQLNKKRKIAPDNAVSRSIQSSEQKQNDKANFILDEDGYVNVFTDGACSSNGYKNARAGIGVWFQDNHPLNVSQPVDGRPTNNMAEIQAVTIAARQAKKAGIKKLKINTDSKFLISCITQWMPRWKTRGWTTQSNAPVKNKVELLEMEKELESLTVAWNHVNGHVGIYGNEMADKLAREGCLQYKNPNY